MRKGFIKRKQKNLLKGRERGTREEHKGGNWRRGEQRSDGNMANM